MTSRLDDSKRSVSHLTKRGAGLVALAALVAVAVSPAAVHAHETDQYTLPAEREFADLGDYLTVWAYNAISKGVKQTNDQIRQAVEAGQDDLVARRQSADTVAANVNRQFPVALFVIEGIDGMATSPKTRELYPGKLPGYKTGNTIRTKIELPLNPLNAWSCGTIQAFGVLFGSDKVGHMTDMGMHYFRAYRAALAKGASEDDAVRAAIRLGTDDPIFSERGILGFVTAGAYSNADLVANYMGLQFYRNLTDPVMLKGEQRPPMLVRDGHYWRVADHVRPDSDFLAWFISDHLNEVLNPELYLSIHRERIRDGIRDRRELIMERYADRHGVRRAPEEFARIARELSTYYGFDYGYAGTPETMLTVDRVVTTKFRADEERPHLRGPAGQTPLHVAASRGDVAQLNRLLDLGGDVNVQVRSKEDRSSLWGMTPLHIAARDGQVEAARLLIDRGADVAARCDRGVTPLHLAVHEPELVRLLLESGAELSTPDERGRTALHWAAFDPAASGLQLLLVSGAAPDRQDNEGQTALHRAVRARNVLATADLLRHGASAGAADAFGVTPLHVTASSSDRSIDGADARNVGALLSAGADPDAQDAFGVTPLYDAARAGNTAVAARLLEAGADLGLATAHGQVPADVAARHGHVAIARLLTAYDQARSAAAVASGRDHADVVEPALDDATAPAAAALVLEPEE